jgi:processive 1,2-diacylglycerol beta-glucosyltransferase
VVNSLNCSKRACTRAVQRRPGHIGAQKTGEPRILILTVSHGAAHKRASQALCKALLELNPGLIVQIEDALHHCSRWFRAYYDSYEIPLKYWPTLWGWIESIQHQSASTGPQWLYRWGAQPLFRFIQSLCPDVVVATEVGVCELAALMKRETKARFCLAGLELMDFNRGWIQPEVDLYLTTHSDLAEELASAGAPCEKITTCGQPIDPAFASLPDRQTSRARLAVEPNVPLLLVLFGGTGFGRPLEILREVRKIRQPLQVVFITGKNPRLENRLRDLCRNLPRHRALGWVDNVEEWMVAADLLISKPGGNTLAEASACGLPMLAFDPLPGNERRTCGWIEKWEAGRWVKQTEDLAPTIERLLTHGEELNHLRERAHALARPHAAHDAAETILRNWAAHKQESGVRSQEPG